MVLSSRSSPGYFCATAFLGLAQTSAAGSGLFHVDFQSLNVTSFFYDPLSEDGVLITALLPNQEKRSDCAYGCDGEREVGETKANPSCQKQPVDHLSLFWQLPECHALVLARRQALLHEILLFATSINNTASCTYGTPPYIMD